MATAVYQPQQSHFQQQQTPSIIYNTIHNVHSPVYDHFVQKQIKNAKSYTLNQWERRKRNDKIMNKTSKSSGDEVLAKLRRTLDSLGFVRHEYQIDFHEEFIKSCLPKIYQAEWEMEYDRILRDFGLTKLQQETLIICPRRYGKTMSVAMFCAAFLWCVPECEIAIFSTGQRTARKLMALILRMLLRIPGFEDRLRTKNAENIVLSFGPYDERKLSCYPGTVAVCILNFSP